MTRDLVTGADGFIGSHLVEAWSSRARVRALVQYNSRGQWGWLDDLPADKLGSVDVQLGDLRDGPALARRCARLRPRLPSRRADRDPVLVRGAVRVHRDERRGTLHVLQAARAEDVERRRPHVDERGVRHARATCRSTRRTRSRASRPTRRARSAPTRSPRASTSRSGAGGDRAPVQHLRPAPERARRDPDDHHPGAQRPRGAARLARPDARPHLRRGHRRRDGPRRRDAGRSARSSTSGRDRA